jgi:hypothetical protein
VTLSTNDTRITALSIITYKVDCHYAECVMLSVTINPIMMTVIILNIVMENVDCLGAKFAAVTYGCN